VQTQYTSWHLRRALCHPPDGTILASVAEEAVGFVATEGLVTDSVGRHVRHSSSQREETLDNG
jgi:hypothetical protein